MEEIPKEFFEGGIQMGNTERVLYGLTREYHVTGYWIIRDTDYTVSHLKWLADKVQQAYPGTELVYVVDNSPSIRHGYFSAKKGLMEDRVLFKVLLQEEGVRVI